MRVLVTGGKGMLGTDLVKVLEEKNHQVFSCDKEDFDITDLKVVNKNVKKINPDIIIHTAAYTDVDGCETNKKLAYKVNALGTRNLVVATNDNNIPIVYFSTDYVFDGRKKGGYDEFDTPNPINYYGQTKLAGEKFVQQLSNKFYIIRVSWLCGHNGNNFIKKILKIANDKTELKIVIDQTGSPTFTRDLAYATEKLISEPAYGIYHITNSGKCTWNQFAKDIFEFAGIDVIINELTTAELNRAATRPEYSILKNNHYTLQGYLPLRHYREALKEYLKNK